MAAAPETKQQFIDAVRQGTHILVTVKTNPSIDQLASCIALTVLLNELGKRATAVFSGKLPESIDFLKPGKMLQSNTDSLQDFIISLDKAKADKLRYKIEDTMVNIYITPYQASLSGNDLTYSKGDFNVDTVIALGTRSKAQLDQAVTVHDGIMQQATVLTMDTVDNPTGDIGAVNWFDDQVSSLSEMLAQAMAELTIDKPESVDDQVATALLAGIVSETESFGNGKTTPTTMEVAGRLLAAGANQELVATRLSGPLKTPVSSGDRNNDRNNNGGNGNGNNNGGGRDGGSNRKNRDASSDKRSNEPRAVGEEDLATDIDKALSEAHLTDNESRSDNRQNDRQNDRNNDRNDRPNKNKKSGKDSKNDKRDKQNDFRAPTNTDIASEPPILSWADSTPPPAADDFTSSGGAIPPITPAEPVVVAAPVAPVEPAMPTVQPLRDQSGMTNEVPQFEQPVDAKGLGASGDSSLSAAPNNLLADDHSAEPPVNPAVADLGLIDPLEGEGDNNGHVPPAAPRAL